MTLLTTTKKVGTMNLFWPDPSPSSEMGMMESMASMETPPTSGSELAVAIRRKPIPRKGHTKSRRGCFQCKRRKVKCQETKPECANCTKIGLDCQYPDARPVHDLRLVSLRQARQADQDQPLLPPPLAPLQSTPTLFTVTDMRFFHHFLVDGYPPLPIMGDHIWREVAALSHTYDYLMHAMLGMAASHLVVHGGEFASQALAHRVKALHLLNEALSKPATCAAEGDARFAAIMSLAFQASCMPDGMTEFLSMIKGCQVIAKSSLMSFEDSLFREFTGQGYGLSVRKAIGAEARALEPEQEELLDEALASLRALAPLCTSPLEVIFMASTERVIHLARRSTAEAFAQFSTQYQLVSNASIEEFTPFVDTDNHPAQLLILHFILIEFIIGYMALGRFGQRFAYREKSCIDWMNRVVEKLPDKYMEYVKWPKEYVDKNLEA